MEANTLQVLEFLGATKRIFNIPVYQRNYNWKHEQCEKLFDDILNINKEKKDIHFIGTIVYVDIKASPSFKEFVIIDGQQRITTILLLLKALHDESDDNDFRDDLYNDYIINNSRKIDEKYRIKLKTVANDSKIFERLISDEYVETEENKGSRIIENYKYFKNRIAESNLSVAEIFYAVEKLTMVYIMLDSEKEDPQLIFESLNSTGLDLTPADLIRNYLLMGNDRETQEYLYKNFWEKIEKKIPSSDMTEFIKDYLTLKTNLIPAKNKIYESFKIFFKNQNLVEKFSVKKILEEINQYSTYYEWINKFNSHNKKLNDSFEELIILKSSVVNPFVLYLLNKYESEELLLDDLIEILDIIKCYIVRRAICNIQTNALNKIFATLSKEVENRASYNENFKETVIGVLLSKTSTGLMPRDEQFKDNFLTKDMYSFKLHKYVFRKLLSYKEKELIYLDDLTLEHIMPQTLSSKWKVDLGAKYEEIHNQNLNLIGNLTLSGHNSELSNRAFAEKKEFYATSNIKFNREIAEYDIWNESTIKERSKKIAKLACEIWKIPQINEKFISINLTNYKNEFDISDDVNVSGRKPKQLNIIGEEVQINSWKEFFIKICEAMCDLDKEKFESLTKHPDFKGKERRIISNTRENIRKPVLIRSNIFIETNLSANDIINYSKLIVEKYEDDDVEVSYKLKNI